MNKTDTYLGIMRSLERKLRERNDEIAQLKAAAIASRVKKWTTARGHRVVNGAHGCAIEVGSGEWHGDATMAGGTAYGPVLRDEAAAITWVTTGVLP